MSKWKVPLSNIDLGPGEIDAAVRVLKSKWLTQGPEAALFEEAFAEYLGVKHAFAVSNGTAALHIAHQVLGAEPGVEVICPAMTFVATANSIIYTGARPVFADINGLDNLNISPGEIEKKITPQTKGITIVHYGGYPCEMEEILAIAKRHALFVVEDASHAPGAEYRGKKCGALGDIGCFSLFSNKNLTTGEGGIVVTNNDDLAEKIKLVRSHGMTTLTWERHKGGAKVYDVVDLGYNYRFDDIRSAMGLVQLAKLDENNGKREEIVKKYRKLLENTKGIIVPFMNFREKSAFHIFPVILEEGLLREDVRRQMDTMGVQTSVHYSAIHLFSYYRERFGHREGNLPFTEKVSDRLVTLPLFPAMASQDVEIVVEALEKSI